MNNIIKRAVFLGYIVVVTAGAALSAPMAVKVKNVVGKVETQSGGVWAAVKEGDSLGAGVSLRTGAGSSCVLVWAGGNTAKVAALSNMKISAADKDGAGKENSTIDLKQGKIVAHAKKLPTKDSSFKVSTPTAVAGVRGTDPIVEVGEGGESTFGVAAGSIEVESGGETTLLDEGFMVDVDSIGSISEPEAIPPEMIEELKEDLKEVNAEAKQAEAEAGGESSAAPAGEEKKEAAAGGGGKEETAAAAEDKEEAESGGDNEEAAAGESEAVSDIIDTVIDNTVNADLADVAQKAGEDAVITGDVDITIDFNVK